MSPVLFVWDRESSNSASDTTLRQELGLRDQGVLWFSETERGPARRSRPWQVENWSSVASESEESQLTRPAYPRQMRYNSSAVFENNAVCSSRLKPEMISL